MKIIKRRRWKILRKDDLPEGNICANDGPGVISRTNYDQEAVAASKVHQQQQHFNLTF